MAKQDAFRGVSIAQLTSNACKSMSERKEACCLLCLLFQMRDERILNREGALSATGWEYIFASLHMGDCFKQTQGGGPNGMDMLSRFSIAQPKALVVIIHLDFL